MTPGLLLTRRSFLTRSAATTAAVAGAALAPAASQADPCTESDPNGGSKSLHITRTVAEWVVNSRYSEIPEAVRKEAVRSVVNSVAATMGGSADPAVAIALRTLKPFSGSPTASLFGHADRLDPLTAALVNGISSHVLDDDDTELRTIIHPAGLVASALFSLAATQPMSGAQFLHAFIVGTEVECRLGNAIYPSHYDLGWHITATCGVFGAAAACGKILGLDAQKMTWALGTASIQAAGLKVVFGSMGKAFQVGRAGQNGLLAALLSAQGFTSSDVPLEGFDGYFHAAARHHDDGELINNLGAHYEISTNTYKPFPCGVVIHPAIDGAIQLNRELHLKPSQIASVELRANPLVLELTGKQTPQTGLEGKFSVYHAVAIALIRGHVGLAEFTNQAVQDPEVVALRNKVKVTTDPSVHNDEVYMTIKTIDGRTFTKHVEHAIGSLQRPMTDADLNDKYHGLVNGILPDAQAATLLDLCWKLESLPDVTAIPKAGATSAA
jgi:2-methylcitrate dehydratase PrpD